MQTTKIKRDTMKQIYNWDNLLPDEVLCHPHKLIRIGTSYVFQDTECNTVRKVTRNPENYQRTKNHLETIRELAKDGAPILPPSPQDPVQLPSGQILTTWPRLTKTKTKNSELPKVLRQLHSTPYSSTANLSPWKPGAKITHRLEKARSIGVPPGLITQIETAWKTLQEELPQDYPTQALIHCDPHRENLGEWNGETVLIDLDDLSTGPPEVDLAPAVADQRKFKEHSYSPNFLEEYAQPHDPALLDKLVSLRHINMTAWLMTLWKIRPDCKKEIIMRVTTWDDKNGPKWTYV